MRGQENKNDLQKKNRRNFILKNSMFFLKLLQGSMFFLKLLLENLGLDPDSP
jgi:hypothetical protein